MEHYGIIYKITNLINGKCYVGQTVNRLSRRIGNHFSRSSKLPIARTLKKYGRNGFKIEELYAAFDKESLDWAEIHFIKINNSLSPNGYNLLSGGSSYGRASFKLREKLSKRQRELHGRRIFACKVADLSNHKNKETLFNSITSASEFTGAHTSDISGILVKKRKFAARWTFRDESGIYPNIKESYLPPNTKSPVSSKDLLTGAVTVYESTHKAVLDGFWSSCIHKCLIGKQRQHGNRLWFRPNQDEPEIKEKRTVKGMIRNNLRKQVIGTCLATGKERVYSYIKETEKDGFIPANVCAVLSGKYKQCKGYVWRYK